MTHKCNRQTDGRTYGQTDILVANAVLNCDAQLCIISMRRQTALLLKAILSVCLSVCPSLFHTIQD